MRFVADLHIHTVASGHAYSTVMENAQVAQQKGLEMIALTDHGPEMPGGPHAYHFSNQLAVPEELFGIRILKGIEANIIDRKGKLDLDLFRLSQLDIVLAGLHALCSPSGSVAENTEAMVNAIKNPFVDIIVHPGNPEFLIDALAVVQAAVKYDVALEVNNSSLTVSRKGSLPHCDQIAALAKQYGAKLVIGSDSHFCAHVGDFGAAVELLEKNNIPEEMVINTSIERIWAHLRRRNNRRNANS